MRNTGNYDPDEVLGELVVLAMLGARVAVGTSHAMAAVMHRAGLAGRSDEA